MKSNLTQKIDAPSWILDDLYTSPNDTQLQKDRDLLKKRASDFSTLYRSTLLSIVDETSISGEDIAVAIKEYEAITDLLDKVCSYAQLYAAQDQSLQGAQQFLGDITRFANEIATELVFFELALNKINTSVIERLINDSPSLARYHAWINNIRLYKAHELSEELEKIFVEKSFSASQGWIRLFDETFSTLRFTPEDTALSLDETLNLLLEEDREKRRKASDALGHTFSQNISLFKHITNILVHDQAVNARWRKFNNVANMRHLHNRISPAIIDTLEKVVVDSYADISHRYYKLKAEMLGLERLMDYDRNAPIFSDNEEKISWAAAQDIVLNAYASFDADMAEIAQQFFDKNWIDATLRKGKAGGAFSHSVACCAHPYILMNYHGTKRDVMTLAHELGHGIHQTLAAKQGALLAPTPLTLAETASVFGEMLVFKHLLKQAQTNREKKILLTHKIEDMIATVIRQISFYRFEKLVHEEGKNGELSTEQLGDFWYRTQAESLGPYVTLQDHYKNFWCYIPHFIHSSFYVYAYAFGDCVVNCLYANYEKQGTHFVLPYKDLLSAGGSQDCEKLMQNFGFDLYNEAFWQSGLSVISSLINELETLHSDAKV